MGWLLAVVLFFSAPQSAATFTIGGSAIAKPMTLSSADLAAMPRESITLKEDDVDVRYDGVLLTTLLTKAGAPIGALRGKALTTTVLAEAKDGYRVVFSLGELDPDFGGAKVIVADQRNGKALFDYQGPFRLIVAGDKRGARGVRMLTALTIAQVQ